MTAVTFLRKYKQIMTYRKLAQQNVFLVFIYRSQHKSGDDHCASKDDTYHSQKLKQMAYYYHFSYPLIFFFFKSSSLAPSVVYIPPFLIIIIGNYEVIMSFTVVVVTLGPLRESLMSRRNTERF